MTERLGHDVPELDQATIDGGWESIGLAKFTFDSCIVAAWSLLPDLAYSRYALDNLVAAGALHLVGVRWPNRLRAVIAWQSRDVKPPTESVRQAYQRACNALARLQQRPDDFAAKLALFDMEVGGRA